MHEGWRSLDWSALAGPWWSVLETKVCERVRGLALLWTGWLLSLSALHFASDRPVGSGAHEKFSRSEGRPVA